MFEVSNSYYKELDKNIIREKFNHLIICFDPTWKKIGVNLSGGADSALLTFFLCSIIKKHNLKTKVDVITYQRCWETRPWQGYVSIQVYNKLKNMFPDIICDRLTTFIPPELEHGVSGEIINGRSGDQIIVGSFNNFAAWNYNLDAVFNATSKNPSFNNREDRMTNRDKDAVDGSLNDLWQTSRKKIQAYPFKFVQKDWIVAQYHLYKIPDLYYTTRSCEGDITLNPKLKEVCGHYKDYKDGMDIPICGECWWCDERDWAERRMPEIVKEIQNG